MPTKTALAQPDQAAQVTATASALETARVGAEAAAARLQALRDRLAGGDATVTADALVAAEAAANRAAIVAEGAERAHAEAAEAQRQTRIAELFAQAAGADQLAELLTAQQQAQTAIVHLLTVARARNTSARDALRELRGLLRNDPDATVNPRPTAFTRNPETASYRGRTVSVDAGLPERLIASAVRCAVRDAAAPTDHRAAWQVTAKDVAQATGDGWTDGWLDRLRQRAAPRQDQQTS